jgi:hypothetical protein
MRAAFACQSSPTGDRGHACRILDDFATAETFSLWPQKGLESWFGRKVCGHTAESPILILFGRVHLRPGEGKPTLDAGAKADPTRTIAFGAQVIESSAKLGSESLRAGYLAMIEAAAAETAPRWVLGKIEQDEAYTG